MIIKRILVLANSTKHHPMSCVAGREVIQSADGTIKWGAWVRPVTAHDEGALSVSERGLAGKGDPRPLDLVDVPLLGPENNPLQPENWLIAPNQPWTKNGAVSGNELLALKDEPPNLWLDPTQKNDRVSAKYLESLPQLQSLYLIRPASFRFEIRSKTWEGVTKKQQRALFEYRGRHYDLSLTDPIIGKKYFPDFPKTAEGMIAIKTPMLLCVSLTPEFKQSGYHFKIVATVLEIPA